MKTKRLYVFDDPAFRCHEAPPGHPERRERLEAISAGIRDRNLTEHLEWREAPRAKREDLLRVHTRPHVERILALDGQEEGIDADTFVSPGSVDAALAAAGSAVAAVDLVLAEPESSAFCLGRPPGHHAESDRAMGFCLLNNVAVAAAYAHAVKGVERVLIFDPDVHHGNGTQEIFYNNPDVCYVSIHQAPLFPGTGMLVETGAGEGRGATANLPLPPGMGDAEYGWLVERFLLPLCRRFDPGLLLVSAGFDAHQEDPLGGMELTGAGYVAIYYKLLAELAVRRVPAVFCLEGGYSLPALHESVPAVLDLLLYGSEDRSPAARPHPAALRLGDEAAVLHALDG